MEKVVKTFAEKGYRPGFLYEKKYEEVAERDPNLFLDDEKIIFVRFFDQEVTIDGEEVTYGEEMNESDYIYYGQRKTLDDLIREFGNNPEYKPLIDDMKRRGIESVCFTRVGGSVPMYEGEVTLDEYFEQTKGPSL